MASGFAPPEIGSAAQLMAMAHALEQEAARRYRELAARMHLRNEQPLADLFQFLASIEEKHAAHILDSAPPMPAQPFVTGQISWDVPENFDEEEGSSRRLTPYRALAVAVRNEDRAFAFYSYIVAHAPDDATRQLAEQLAKDELDHAFLLRRERRKAFRRQPSDDLAPGFHLPSTIEEFAALTAETEFRVAQYHRRLSETLTESDPVRTIFAEIAAEEERCARQAAGGRGVQSSPWSLEPAIDDGLRLLEEQFDRYMDIAGRAKDEKIVEEAQRLAEATVRHLSMVNASLKQPAL